LALPVPQMTARRDVIVAFSLANVLFLDIWRPFHISSDVTYYYKNLPGWIDLAAVTLDILLLAGVLFAAAAAVRRSRSGRVRTAGRIAFLGLCVVALFCISPETARLGGMLGSWIPRWFWQFDMPIERWMAVVLAPVMLLVVLLVVVFARPLARAGVWALSEGRPVRFAVALLLIFSPAGPIFFVNTARLVSGYVGVPGFGALPIPTPSEPSGQRAANRVLWIVLDEWDQTITFERRPSDVALPEIDALRRQSLDATRVDTPGWRTLISLPALISGARAFDSYATDSKTLMLAFRGRSTHTDWRKLPNVFARARERGAQTALVGWYHPYSRIFADDLTRSYWEPTFQVNALFPNQPTLGGQMRRFALFALRGVPGLSSLVSEVSSHMAYKRVALENYANIREASYVVALDPNIDFAFLHWPIPHVPGISVPGTGASGLDPRSSYFDNLVLLDRSLGELRREMEAAGLWDRTTVLLSSDHPARLNLWPSQPEWLSDRDEALMHEAPELAPTVPFLLKLAGRHEGAVYERPFNAVLSQGLLLAVLDGEVASNEAAMAWLDRHAAESLQLSYGAP
jgi:hypothetical protein